MAIFWEIYLSEKIFLLFDMGNTNELFHKLDLFGPTVVFTDFCKQKNVLGTIWTIKSKQINIKTIIRKWYEWSRQSYAMKTNLLKINSLLNYLSHPTSIFLHNKSLDQLQFDLYLFRQLYVCHRSVANQRTRHCNQAALKHNLFYRLKQ